jgi:hypothetical protein
MPFQPEMRVARALTHSRTHALTRGVNFTDLRGEVAVAGADTQGRGKRTRSRRESFADLGKQGAQA